MTASKWHVLGPQPDPNDELTWLELSQNQFLPTVTQDLNPPASGEKPAEAGEEKHSSIPDELAILPLRGVVVFPFTVVPLTVGQPRSMKLVDDASVGQRVIGLVSSMNAELESPGPDDLAKVGTAAQVLRLFRRIEP